MEHQHPSLIVHCYQQSAVLAEVSSSDLVNEATAVLVNVETMLLVRGTQLFRHMCWLQSFPSAWIL